MPALFLTAPSGTGKTYALNKALANCGASYYGVVTYKVKSPDGLHTDVFIAPVTGAPIVGVCNGAPRLVATSREEVEYCAKMGASKIKEPFVSVPKSEKKRFAHIFPSAFDSTAAFIARDAKNIRFSRNGILLLDELGRLESDAYRFQAAVLRALELPQKTIGVIQKVSTPFLDKVRQNECVTVLEFKGNELRVRDKLYQAAADFINS